MVPLASVQVFAKRLLARIECWHSQASGSEICISTNKSVLDKAELQCAISRAIFVSQSKIFTRNIKFLYYRVRLISLTSLNKPPGWHANSIAELLTLSERK